MRLFRYRHYRMWGNPKDRNVPGSYYMDLPDVAADDLPEPPVGVSYLSPLLSFSARYINVHLQQYQLHDEVQTWWLNLEKEDRQKPAEIDVVITDSLTVSRRKPLRRVLKRQDGAMCTEVGFVIPVEIGIYSGVEDFEVAKVWGRYISEQVVVTLQTVLGLPPAPRVGFLGE